MPAGEDAAAAQLTSPENSKEVAVRTALTLITSVLVIGPLSMGAASSALAAPPIWVPDSTASLFLGYSLWAYQNHANAVHCTGIGAVRHFAGGDRSHLVPLSRRGEQQAGGGSGREGCRPGVAEGDHDRAGDVHARPWPRAAAQGAADSGQHGCQHGARRLELGEEQARRTGVLLRGRADRQTATADLFYAFSCATIDMFGQQSVQVLITATGARSVRVVKTFTR